MQTQSLNHQSEQSYSRYLHNEPPIFAALSTSTDPARQLVGNSLCQPQDQHCQDDFGNPLRVHPLQFQRLYGVRGLRI